MFQKEKQLCRRKSGYSSNIQLGVLHVIKIESGCNDDKKSIKFNFCITNLPTCGVTQKRKYFLRMTYE